MLTGSNQNGENSRCDLDNVGHTQTLQFRDTECTYVTRKGIGVEHGNVVRPSGRRKVTREGAGDLASMRGRKKRMTICSGWYTGSRFARHESEPTSHWCFVAREFAAIEFMKEGK